ncbi:MAG: hypothetical protein IIY96_00240, partial [Lachnospiraceae bacterium]|nr:hypothetical protein [Lachnospiraceae bacterium]
MTITDERNSNIIDGFTLILSLVLLLAAAAGAQYTGGRVPFTKDYAIIEKAGMRIAVVGYIPDYSKDVMSSKMAPYRIDGSLRH